VSTTDAQRVLFQDILEDDDIKLDTNFKQSLTMDLVQVNIADIQLAVGY